MNMRVLMVVLIGCMIAPGLTSAAVLTVDDSGGMMYMSIWDALENANPGDDIIVYDGVYTGQGSMHFINVYDDDIDITAVNLHGAVIDDAYFRSDRDGLRIQGFKGEHTGGLPFAYMTPDSHNVQITFCHITGDGDCVGINAWGDSITISDCIFDDLAVGVSGAGTAVNTVNYLIVRDNQFKDFTGTSEPIKLEHCTSPDIDDNSFINCGTTKPLIKLLTTTSPDVTENGFTSCTTTNALIDMTTATSALIDLTTFSNCVTTESLIYMSNVPSATIGDTIIDNTMIGTCTASEFIKVDDSDKITIDDAYIHDSTADMCIYIKDSETATVKNVDITRTAAAGIMFDTSPAPNVEQCTFSGVGVYTSPTQNWCIRVVSLAWLDVTDCTFTDGCANPIYISGGTCFSSTILQNTFTGIGNGADDTCAVYIASGASFGGVVKENTFNAGNYELIHYGGGCSLDIYNNIIDGSVYDDSKSGHASQTWSASQPFVEQPNIIGGKYIAGNSWSDYEGWDSDNDGIGDVNVPHHHDQYPITNRWQIYDQTGVHGATTEMITNKWFVIPGVEVNMYNSEKSFIAYTDENGHWVFTNTSHELTNGTYYITAKKDRYKTASPFTVNYTIGNVTFAEIKMERDTGQYYSRHEVTFLVCNMWKAPHIGVDVHVFIDGLLDQTAITGTDGTVTFIMFVDVEYTIEFDGSIPIDPMTIRIQPHDSYYVIYTSRTQYSPDNENTYEGKVEWYWTARETPYGAWLNLTWVDYTHRATRLRAWANSTTSTFSTDIEVNTFTDYNVTIPLWVDNQHNNSYILHVETDHPDYPELAHSHFMPWSFIDRMVDFVGFSEDWQYATTAACILIFVALMFSGVSLSAGALVVVMLGWMFVWIEWINGTYLNYAMMVFATIVAVGYILKTNERL